ncbi:hypothetical protein LB559_00435 [Mesorhizobium sp. BR1-1-3]|uniref:hypothetical protein n=1 Tax=Mesorhizobium sp. BR1-1-3 TaxID=2876651 RepID=UPI001CD0EE76|nr:hypothetical protein [Mesorhizobium sp. BR1-1-3]MBZ9886412.1 hypothetical protein [Mesorhizobium sp. BR1-1-3]
MDHKPALYALLRLHAEIGGKIKENKVQALKLIEDMKHVEAVLHMLEPGFNARTIAPKRRNNPNPLFKRGHVIRAALGVLRAATAPMSAEEIGIALLRSKGVPEPTRAEIELMYGSVSASLKNNRDVIVHEGRPRRWSLARDGN